MAAKKNDVLQVLMLTLFMVSGILAFFSLLFGNQREDTFDRAQKAVREYARLKEELKDPTLREALTIAKRLEQSKGNKGLHAEINDRLSNERVGLNPASKSSAKPDKSLKYNVHEYPLDSTKGRDVEKDFDYWVSFLGRIEAERPDIHVSSLNLDTKAFDITEGGTRPWSCRATLVLWEPREN